MAKKEGKRIRVTDEMVDDAMPHFVGAVNKKLAAIGAKEGAKNFRRDERRQRSETKRWYQRFLDDGGKVGDWKSFIDYIIQHGDEIIAFLSKFIALFTTLFAKKKAAKK